MLLDLTALQLVMSALSVLLAKLEQDQGKHLKLNIAKRVLELENTQTHQGLQLVKLVLGAFSMARTQILILSAPFAQ